MRGVVFSEFLSSVEEKFGLDMVETLLEKTNPPSGGVYTAVGAYPYEELHAMIMELSKQIHMPPEILIEKFGMHIFSDYAKKYPDIMAQYNASIPFIKDFGKNIQFEIEKLHHEGETIPSFTYTESENELELVYDSAHPLVHFAKGLLESTFRHFKDAAFIKTYHVSDDWKHGTFIIAR